MRSFTLFLLLVIFPALIFAQKTSVSGTVIGGEGQVVRLLAFDDFISKKIITLGKDEIAEDGHYLIDFELNKTICAFLDINYQRAEIFLEPGNSYAVNITYNPANQLESYFDRQGLIYGFNDKDEYELNRLIWQFNAMYNKFVMEDFELIYRLHDKSLVADFRAEVEEAFDGIDNTYFREFIQYKMADVEQFAKLKGQKLLAEEYFTDKPVLYNNVEYTYFFEEFFEKFLTTSPNVITISDLIIAVNDSSNNQMIIDAMAGEPYLQNENFRELVLIYSLKSLYYNGTYKKSQVLTMIKDINTSTLDPIHKQITSNLLETLTRLSVGSPAPNLKLSSIGGHEFQLKSITGKPILLTFFLSGRKGTENDFERIAELYNYYKSGLEIISISMDNEPNAYLPLANSGGYHWTFAHYGNDPLVYDLYNIKNLPLYVLIDVEGNIAAYPAPAPGDELERAVMRVIH